MRLGVAGWGIASRYLDQLPIGGTHLERYARVFSAVEINTSFYRHHQLGTYARWAQSVGPAFRFSVKTPKALTHEGSLGHTDHAVLERFLGEVAGLGAKLRALLIQLPPSLPFERADAEGFLTQLRRRIAPTVAIVCEPRHASWSSDTAEALFKELAVSRSAVDPPRWRQDAIPGGGPHLAYFRMHGSPRTYFSDYAPPRLETLARELQAAMRNCDELWCIFDNTAHGYAIGNALSAQRLLNVVSGL
ncbi:MAG: DUF72 domain-containing protein [Steroidobacteraceae bacterium]